ncbi:MULTISPECIES: hypothetical protein [unclassified Nocardia]|uniref:DUF7373 family lipoprotein n=1 Tax=unclassified Nocardia TaxID=2637762 RepID=UPI001CE40226|nr:MULTISPECIES: hypothetical protein [unclassified Nocardia]
MLRFGTPDQAGHALSVLAGAQAAQPNTTDTSIPAYPDARAEINEYGTVMTWLVRDTYLVWTIVEDNLAPAPDPAPLSRFTARIYDKLFEMLRDYHPTPPDRLATLPADVDGLLGRTLPSPKTPDWTPAILTPRAALHRDYYPARTSRIFADAKVDLLAIDLSTITRAGDRPAAARLLAAYVDQLSEDYGPFDGPPGLPGAKCLKKLDDPVGPAVVTYTCFIGYDRYVAQVWAEQPQDLYQEAAAQYKLLAAGH